MRTARLFAGLLGVGDDDVGPGAGQDRAHRHPEHGHDNVTATTSSPRIGHLPQRQRQVDRCRLDSTTRQRGCSTARSVSDYANMDTAPVLVITKNVENRRDQR